MSETDEPSIFLLLLPTRYLYECIKRKAKDRKAFARRWPSWFISIELFASVALIVIPKISTRELTPWVTDVVGILAAFRVGEIAYAYYCDAIDTLGQYTNSWTLDAADKIKLAIKSYGSLILDWALIYYSLPLRFFRPPLGDFLDAVYISGTTITTLGYGDITPLSSISRIACVCEALVGLLVIVVALGSYLVAAGNRTRP